MPGSAAAESGAGSFFILTTSALIYWFAKKSIKLYNNEMFGKLFFKYKPQSRTLIISCAVVGAFVLGGGVGLSMSRHNDKPQGPTHSGTSTPPKVAGAKVEASAPVSANPKTSEPTPPKNNSTSTNTTTTQSKPSSGSAQTNATQTNVNTVPVVSVPQYQTSITFSSDGCYVTATGTPGTILSGSVHDEDNRKGGPMGAPEGIAIPSSGTVTEGIGAGIGTAQSLTVIDAILSDAQGNVVLAKTGAITSPSCSE